MSIKAHNCKEHRSHIYKCKECGKTINSFLKNMEEWGWKINRNGGDDYFCSYSCMRKAEKRKEDIKNKKEKAQLLNKYNGVLTLKECKFIEDLRVILFEEKNKKIYNMADTIKSRKDFKNFIRFYYDDIKDLLNLK